MVVSQALDLSTTEAASMALAGIEATWLDESDKASLRSRFAREINELRACLNDGNLLTNDWPG